MTVGPSFEPPYNSTTPEFASENLTSNSATYTLPPEIVLSTFRVIFFSVYAAVFLIYGISS